MKFYKFFNLKVVLAVILSVVFAFNGIHIKNVIAQETFENVIDRAENILSDLFDEQDVDVMQELQNQLAYYQQLYSESESVDERNKLTGLMSETNRLLAEYSLYQQSMESNATLNQNQSILSSNIANDIIVATAIALFNVLDYLLSAELLTHASENTQIYSTYYPIHGYLIQETVYYEEMLEDDSTSKTFGYNTDNTSNPVYMDLALSLHSVNYRKAINNFYLMVFDIYDFDEKEETNPYNQLNNLFYDIQEEGNIVPYYVEIGLYTRRAVMTEQKYVNISTVEDKRYYEDVAILRGSEHYKEYFITFEDSGVKLIQTFGLLRVRMFIYNENGTLITVTSEGGYGKNVAYWLSAEAGKTYRIRLRCHYSSDSGATRFTITPASRVKNSNSTSLTSYEDIFAVVGSNNYRFISFSRELTTAAITYTPSSDGVYTVQLESSFDNYVYIIDPTTNREIEVEAKTGEGLPPEFQKQVGNTCSDTIITSKLKAGIPYLIIYSQKNIEEMLLNYDDADTLHVRIKKV